METTKDPYTALVEMYEELQKLHVSACHANIALIKGYKLLLAALNMDGMNRETLRDIIKDALGEANQKINPNQCENDQEPISNTESES